MDTIDTIERDNCTIEIYVGRLSNEFARMG